MDCFWVLHTELEQRGVEEESVIAGEVAVDPQCGGSSPTRELGLQWVGVEHLMLGDLVGQVPSCLSLPSGVGSVESSLFC